jgi:drug/metabolite transporter (DMT)-like permease
MAVVLGTLGQLFFKAGTHGAKLAFDFSMVKIFFTPYVMAGVLCYLVSTAVFLKVLSQEELSYAYPMISLTYPFVLLFSWLVFKEPIPLLRWIGVAFIIIGVYFVGKKV